MTNDVFDQIGDQTAEVTGPGQVTTFADLEPTPSVVDDATATALIAYRAFAAQFYAENGWAPNDFRDALYDAVEHVDIAALQNLARALGKSDPSAYAWTVVGVIASRLFREAGNAALAAAELAAADAPAVRLQVQGREYTLTLESPERAVVRNSRDEITCYADRLPNGCARVSRAPKSWTGAAFQDVQAAAAELLRTIWEA